MVYARVRFVFEVVLHLVCNGSICKIVFDCDIVWACELLVFEIYFMDNVLSCYCIRQAYVILCALNALLLLPLQ